MHRIEVNTILNLIVTKGVVVATRAGRPGEDAIMTWAESRGLTGETRLEMTWSSRRQF